MSNLDQIVTGADGSLMIRIIKKQAGVPVGFHRCTVAPGGDENAVLTAVNNDLTKNLGCDPVDASWNAVAPIKAAVPQALIDAYNQKMQAIAAAAQAAQPIPSGNLSIGP